MADDMSAELERLLEQVRVQQEEVARIQRGVQSMQVEGSSRDNSVTVTVLGTGRFSEVSIDPETIRRYDARDLGEIVLEAINDGVQKLAEASQARFAPIIEAASAPPDFS